jgi:uncharacterized membrane protein YqjE
MDETPQEAGGMLTTVARMLRTLRDVAENRVELFLLELKEERVRLFDALLLAVAGMVLALMALILVTFTVVLIFWDTYRLLVLILLTAAYAAAAAAMFASLRSRLRRWQSFAATHEQLKKDSACFKKPN